MFFLIKSALSKTGKLLETAKENVIAQGYEFVKGNSRGKLKDNSGSESQNKRRKIDKDEREKEIKDTTEILKNMQEQISFKQLRLQKQKSINDFSKCDQISGEIRKLLNEKKVLEKQLKRLEKKDAKSKWYHSTKQKEKSKIGESHQKGKRQKLDVAKMLKKESDVSTSMSTSVSDSNESQDTIILSADESDEVPIVSPLKQSDSMDFNPYIEQSQPYHHEEYDDTGDESSQELFSQQVHKDVDKRSNLQRKERDDIEQDELATVDQDFL